MIIADKIIEFNVLENFAFPRANLDAAMDIWESVADIDFVSVPDQTKSEMVFANLEDVKSAFGIVDDGYIGINVSHHDANGDIFKSYIGLDPSNHGQFSTTRLATHEIGHSFGFQDEWWMDPNKSIMSYEPSNVDGLGSYDIKRIQDLLGPSRKDDLISGSATADTIKGGEGVDTVIGGASDDLIYGNQGNDILYGNTQNDTLFGGAGDDTLYGGAGDDVLFGNAGNNVAHGGAGFDTVRLTSAPVHVDANSAVSEDGSRIELIGVERVQYGQLEWLL